MCGLFEDKIYIVQDLVMFFGCDIKGIRDRSKNRQMGFSGNLKILCIKIQY